MEERKFVQMKKEELGVKEYIKSNLGKGKISTVQIEYTPIGEKIIVSTTKPGFVIGKRGEKINELTDILKKRFNLENPHIEIQEILNPDFDAQNVADDLALALERMGNLKFKVIAYRAIDRIMKSGALGVEIVMSGKLPSKRAKTWRFAQGYLKKTGDTAKVVNKAQAISQTQPGVTGIKVSILPPDAKIEDRIIIDDKIRAKINQDLSLLQGESPQQSEKSHSTNKSEKKIKKANDNPKK
ncbi:MAG: 30S ribosomal protein S3 [Nanoarchaeota archaeon]|nr:30S ribosomal protein S3 [Nanoarchaeota archaeon]